MAPDVVDLYLRKSTKDEGRSVERQLSELTDAAEREDLQVGRVFADPDFSASRFAKRARPDYAALLGHIRSGACQVLGLFEASRGSRSIGEWIALIDECRDRKIRIWIWTDERIYRPWKTSDYDALARMGVNAATESNQISDRVLSGKRKAAREGKPAGRLQYGFRRVYDEKGKFVRQEGHPDQAPILAEMVDRIAGGERLAVIARDLNDRGLTMPGGQPWHGRFIRQMVLRPSIAGRRVHQGQDIGPASWEPIVDVAKWRKAVAILTRPERRTTTRGTELAHWLTNAVACGTCRTTKLRARTGGTKRPRITYQCDECGMVVSAVALEGFVERVLLARLERADAASIFVARTDDAATAAAQREVDGLEAELSEWRTLAKARKVSPASFAEFEGDLLPRIERAREKVRQLTVPPEHADLSMTDVPARWPGFGPALKRRYARALVDLVVHPAARRGPVFDPARLGASRWTGDPLTWAEHWAADDLST